jgi:hypothetical protein
MALGHGKIKFIIAINLFFIVQNPEYFYKPTEKNINNRNKNNEW